MEGTNKFILLGLKTMMPSNFYMMLPFATNLGEEDIFVTISTCACTKDVLKMVQYANKQSATVIAITKLDQSSLLRKVSYICLCMPDACWINL